MVFALLEVFQSFRLFLKEYFALQAALGESPGCGDSNHNTQDTCEADEACEWSTRSNRDGRCVDRECPGPAPKPLEAPLYLDFLPAFISVIYEAVGEDGNILNDDVLQIIKDS